MAEQILDTFFVDYKFRTDTTALRGLDSKVGNIRTRLNGLSTGLAVAGGALTGALFGAGRGILSFETEMNRLRRDAVLTADELAALRQQALELGSSADYTTISITDVVVAQREWLKSGVELKDAMAAVPSTLDFVAATEIEVGEAAAKSAKLLKAYGLEVKDITRLHDLIAYTSVNTGATAAELVDTLLRVGPTAETAGIGLEDMAASLALLVDQGQISERTATSLERALVILSKVEVLPPQAREALRGLGVDLTQLQDLMAQGDVIGAFRRLADANLNVAAASQIFGEDGLRAVLGLTKQIGNLESFRAELDNTSGSIRRAANEMNRGLPGAFAALKSSADTAVVALGDAGLTAGLTSLAVSIREAVEAFMGLPRPVQSFTASVLLAGPALIGAGAALRGVSFALGGLTPALRLGKRLNKSYAASWNAVRTAVLGAALAVRGNWNLAWGRMVRNMRIGGLTGAIRGELALLARRGRMAFASLATSSGIGFGAIKTAAVAAWASISGPLLPVLAAVGVAALVIRRYWEPLRAFFGGFWTGFTEAIGPVMTIFDPLYALISGIAEAFGLATDDVEGWAEAGVAAGRAVAGALELLLLPLRAVIETAAMVGEVLGLVGEDEAGRFRERREAERDVRESRERLGEARNRVRGAWNPTDDQRAAVEDAERRFEAAQERLRLIESGADRTAGAEAASDAAAPAGGLFGPPMPEPPESEPRVFAPTVIQEAHAAAADRAEGPPSVPIPFTPAQAPPSVSVSVASPAAAAGPRIFNPTVNQEVNVQTGSGDPAEIARAVSSRSAQDFNDSLRTLMEDFDSDVDR